MAMQLVHYTDCGPVRPVNQDAYCALVADTPAGPVSLLAVCDGMGGLSSGEVASATVIHAFAFWFEQRLPGLLQGGALHAAPLSDSWNQLLKDCHHRLRQEAARRGIQWGTTLSLILLTRDAYYLLHVGDSRIYLQDGPVICQLTQDQTLAMQQVASGAIDPGAYEQDSRRNVLLQCVGNRSLSPFFRIGDKPRSGAVLLCSDGFYHTLRPEDLRLALTPARARSGWQQTVTALAQAGRRSGETDNITAVGLRWDDQPSPRQSTLPLWGAGGAPRTLDFRAKVICTHAQPI